jgi:hypothetical protein
VPRVLKKRGSIPQNAVYVGRPSPFGNPFIVGVDGEREECIALYYEWISRPEAATLRERMKRELAGKDLVCHCAPLPCHATIVMEIANGH